MKLMMARPSTRTGQTYRPTPILIIPGATAAPKKKMGRPSEYTPERATAICDRLMAGESLRSICSDPEMPARLTVANWLAAHPDFMAQYTRVRDVALDGLADQLIDEATKGVPYEQVAAARLAFDARRWYLSKLAPKRYGDRLTTEISGPDGRPVELRPAPLTAPEVAAEIKRLLADAEVVAGLPVAPKGVSDGQRLKLIVNADAPLTPALYEIVYSKGEG